MVKFSFIWKFIVIVKLFFLEYFLFIDVFQFFFCCWVYIIDYFWELIDNIIIYVFDDCVFVMWVDDSILYFCYQEEVIVFGDFLDVVIF